MNFFVVLQLIINYTPQVSCDVVLMIDMCCSRLCASLHQQSLLTIDTKQQALNSRTDGGSHIMMDGAIHVLPMREILKGIGRAAGDRWDKNLRA